MLLALQFILLCIVLYRIPAHSCLICLLNIHVHEVHVVTCECVMSMIFSVLKKHHLQICNCVVLWFLYKFFMYKQKTDWMHAKKEVFVFYMQDAWYSISSCKFSYYLVFCKVKSIFTSLLFLWHICFAY